jgi:prepilin-type processing-associated H-X9-DG protein
LLVVLGIIALLIAFLLPALVVARQQAASMQCESNLRQWAIAANLYANQWRGCLPRRGTGQQPTLQISRPEDWFNALPPLMKMRSFYDLVLATKPPQPADGTLWTCPQASGAPDAVNYFAYAMNMALSTWNAPQPDRVDKVGQPATMVFMVDGAGPYCSALPRNQPYSPVARHRGHANVAFLDGHVASIDAAYLGCQTGDPNHADVRWLVPNSVWQPPPP